MSDIFENAVSAIQIGLEDFETNLPKRSLSAVRNIFAGIILLAKEAVCVLVPDADADLVLAAKLKMVSDGSGDIKFEKQGHSTIDVREIFERFSNFGQPLPKEVIKVITDLQSLRNEIEHKSTNLSHEALQEAIAKAFPVILYFFVQLDENPAEALEGSYNIMMEMSEAYKIERARCISTFHDVVFPFDELSGEPFYCDDCNTELVEQVNPSNSHHEDVESRCNACNTVLSAEEATEKAINHKHGYSVYKDGISLIETCTECGLDTYLTTKGCIWCQKILGECARCGTELTPNTTDSDNESVCDYCGHMMSKY